ncbi:MAG: sodium:solute symporter family protein [Acidobacteria bacterium]|nr:sodium:solute symporter family protein [Acidobacteriota bacterium]MXZ36970.1 sodium:solute symporter family protein [Holophagales bacterium]
MNLIVWSWLFLVVYLGGMLAFGVIGRNRVQGADDFATARAAYGPFFLALAFAATTASGATFLGFPGLAYEHGTAALLSAVLYPAGVYLGVLICMRLVANVGDRFGSRSIPEFLGDRYQSDGIRVIVTVASLLLFFYLAGQLLSGLVMFETMLGLSPAWALGITAVVLMIYVSLGGAHADILTDGVQGFLMLLIGVLVILLFLFGAGLDGGFGSVISSIRGQDPNQVGWINRSTPLYHSWWSQMAVLLAHIPLGLLPHIGNKIWALKTGKSRFTFLRFASVFGVTLGMLGLGGALARAVLGGRLYEEGSTPNEALPALFIELFPAWLAALIGVGILSAVMSTADGLVVSSSQIVANDLYRRTIAPRFHSHLSDEQLDRRVLLISRWATVGVMVVCVTMAWMLMDMNIAILVWTGNGGMMAAFAGPLVLGALWSGVTRTGAYTGLIVGLTSFLILHTGVIDPAWFEGSFLHPVFSWLHGEAPNPTSCAALAGLFAMGCTAAVSLATKPLPEAHVGSLFRRVPATD